MINAILLLIGWLLDLLLGDPARLPHPVVGFGKMIAYGEKRLNKGVNRKLKGGLLAVCLILLVFGMVWVIRYIIGIFALFIFDGTHQQVYQLPVFLWIFDVIAIFYCLAGTTLIREVRAVFMALDRSLEEGRKQVARIVGRDQGERIPRGRRKRYLSSPFLRCLSSQPCLPRPCCCRRIHPW